MPTHFTLLAAALTLLSVAPSAAREARTVYLNGKIFTADPAAPWAQALAVEGGVIIAVGDNDRIGPLANGGARVIDLQQRTLIPGLNDSHVHVVVPLGEYLNAPSFLPGPGPTLPEVLATLQSGASATPPGSWLFMFVGTGLSEDPTADRFALDTVSQDHPVALFAWWGHGIWLNSRAMAVLGIADEQPDPFGGFYERVVGTQVLTGVAHEYAEFLIRRGLLDLLPDEAIVAQYQAFAGDALRYGFTTLQDMAVGLTRDRTLAVLGAANLPLRVRSICFPLDPTESCEVNGDAGPLVTPSGVKYISDGTPIERLAFLEGFYADRPGFSGTFDLGDALPGILGAALGRPPRTNQLLFHAVGDGAVDRVLDGLSATGGPDAWSNRRIRIEHGDLLFPPSYARARDLGVVIVQNPTHLALTGVFAQRFDASTFAQLEPLRSLLEQGIPLALGTDGIGHPFNPFLDIFLAAIHPTHPSEALTVEQAVTAYTRGSAYAEFEENRKGMLAPGYRADLAVLSQDIFSAPLFLIPATESVLTVVGGEVAWDAGVLTSSVASSP
jgi:predicted amidohydrolase YtcJ